jgi:threonine/homoserine/homoserine lactone efflux protein
MKPKRNIIKIVIGIFLILAFGINIPIYMSGSAEANAALATSFIAIAGGMYLLYRGLYPSK